MKMPPSFVLNIKGKNVFDGTSFNKTVVINEKVSQSDVDWNNKYSGKKLYDETLACGNIDRLYEVMKTYH